jgi:hypothetical protein
MNGSAELLESFSLLEHLQPLKLDLINIWTAETPEQVQELRSNFWKKAVRKELDKLSSPFSFEKYVSETSTLNKIIREEISMDIGRTALLAGKLGEEEKELHDLRTCLEAYASRNPSVGYCQGLFGIFIVCCFSLNKLLLCLLYIYKV